MRVWLVGVLMLRLVRSLPLKSRVHRSFKWSSLVLSQSRINDENAGEEKKPKLTRIRLGSEQELQRAEMEERIKDSQRWVSRQLTDKEAEDLNRMLGIDEELLNGVSIGKQPRLNGGSLLLPRLRKMCSPKL